MAAPLRTLIKRLDPHCYNALESAGGLCLSRSHYEVDLEHLFAKLLEGNNTDLHMILNHYDQNQDRVRKDLDAAMDKFKTGNTRTPVFSPRIQRLLELSWMVASTEFEASQIRSAHILIAAMGDTEFAVLLERTSDAFGKINPDELKTRLDEITAGSAEAAGEAGAAARAAGASGAPAGPTGQGELGKYTVNLTERREGRKDRPGPRPRRRDPPDDRHPDAPPPEQPDPHRRGRRRQDRGGRGPGAAHRRGRRAADPARAWRCSASTSACCRPAPA